MNEAETQHTFGYDPAHGEDRTAYVEVSRQPDGWLKVERILTVLSNVEEGRKTND